MRKIVDSNFLREPALRDYLSESTSNFAVLTDYSAMEAYKSRSLNTLYESMSILKQHPEQVIVLKNTLVVCGLGGRTSGLQDELIDEDQTRGFVTYCRALEAAESGDEAVLDQLLDNRAAAVHQLDERMLRDATTLSDAIDGIAQTYSREDLRTLRTGGPLSTGMISRLLEHVLFTTRAFFETHPSVRQWPSIEELPNTFLCRVALCAHLLALEWIAVGGAKGARPERLRNDLVDANFAAFATYFDGLLSNDEKCQRIHMQARYILDAIGCRISGMTASNGAT